MNQFPKNFVWGVATASHQIEGNTINDWIDWEKQNAARLAKDAPKTFAKTSPVWEQIKAEATDPANYISGRAANSYELFEEDLKLIKELGVNAYRFSIEWSRICPDPKTIDKAALDHYKNIVDRLHQEGVTPWVTILHRPIPRWVAAQGGWASKKTVDDFARYTHVLVETFGDKVKHWMPLNEPMLNVGGGFFAGRIPPSRKNPLAGFKAFFNMVKAHNNSFDIIHQTIPDAQVGSAHAAIYAEPYNNRFYNKWLVDVVHFFANWIFLDKINDHSDFVGIQYYTRGVIGLPLKTYPQPGPHSDMAQEIYPLGIYKFIKMTHDRYHKPIVVTENGVADRDDQLRPAVIHDHIAEIDSAIKEGVDVRGYFHWSLLDNYEWDRGFWPKFGLAHVNRTTFKRTFRPSAQIYIDIIKANRS